MRSVSDLAELFEINKTLRDKISNIRGRDLALLSCYCIKINGLFLEKETVIQYRLKFNVERPDRCLK